MRSITRSLPKALATVDRPGDFYAHGIVQFAAPRLEVEGVGRIALPLLPVQSESLLSEAEPAPYGRGEETLLDPNVRRTWQIDAQRLRIEGRHWERQLDAIVARAAVGLGVDGPVTAELYKLLIYDAGSFFVRHRDTEKIPGMFATLVIVLPSDYAGGELIVRHGGREVRLDLSCPDPAEAAFAAFYADCLHEIAPVTAGYRLALIYNLKRHGKGPEPSPPSYGEEQDGVAALLRDWAKDLESAEEDVPEKLVYALEHAYTPAELSFEALKGADAAAASVLKSAAEAAECELHLALVTIEESGSAEYLGDYGWDEGADSEEDEFEVVEVIDRILRLSHWRKPDGSASHVDEFPFEETELCPPDAFDNLKADEVHFEEATGNEGASFERTYRRAGLVIWPRSRVLAVFNQAGLGLTLPFLGDLVGKWEESGADRDSPLWRQAHELSGHMLRTWRGGWRGYDEPAGLSSGGEMLSLLAQLGDIERAEAFLANVTGQGHYAVADNEAILRALQLSQPERAVELLRQIMAGNGARQTGGCADLLLLVIESPLGSRGLDLRPAATALLSALPGDSVSSGYWGVNQRIEPDGVVSLLDALERIDPPLALGAVDHFLAWPGTYPLDGLLVPAARRWLETKRNSTFESVERLRTLCIEHLEQRSAEPLAPPRDWKRAAELHCRCKDCAGIAAFLADADRETLNFPAVEERRRHVEAVIRRSGSDLDLGTDKRSRPYILVCRKNTASYRALLEQRHQDLENLSVLRGSSLI